MYKFSSHNIINNAFLFVSRGKGKYLMNVGGASSDRSRVTYHLDMLTQSFVLRSLLRCGFV